jgi:hypothetical protein
MTNPNSAIRYEHLALASAKRARVDAACRRGILIKARSVASIRSILKNGALHHAVVRCEIGAPPR